MRSLLNASTSRDALPLCAAFVFEDAASLFDGSMVSSVFLKGFGGAWEALLSLASEDVSDKVLSKGSSSRWLGVGTLLYIEASPPTNAVGVSRLDGEDG
jgi:hypothetical protein